MNSFFYNNRSLVRKTTTENTADSAIILTPIIIVYGVRFKEQIIYFLPQTESIRN